MSTIRAVGKAGRPRLKAVAMPRPSEPGRWRPSPVARRDARHLPHRGAVREDGRSPEDRPVRERTSRKTRGGCPRFRTLATDSWPRKHPFVKSIVSSSPASAGSASGPKSDPIRTIPRRIRHVSRSSAVTSTTPRSRRRSRSRSDGLARRHDDVVPAAEHRRCEDEARRRRPRRLRRRGRRRSADRSLRSSSSTSDEST